MWLLADVPVISRYVTVVEETFTAQYWKSDWDKPSAVLGDDENSELDVPIMGEPVQYSSQNMTF